MGFRAVKLFSMASWTAFVASVQIWMSSWRRSSFVMMPLRCWASTFSASFSCWSRILPFSFGVMTSSMPMVNPAGVEGHERLVGRGEPRDVLILDRPLVGDGQVIDPEDHVLGRRGDGPPVSRRQDVVGGQHQDA